jgi:hypothetical protein
MKHDHVVDMMYTKEDYQKRFTPWTEEKMEKQRMMEQERFAQKPCKYGIDPPKWQRKGKDLQIELVEH